MLGDVSDKLIFTSALGFGGTAVGARLMDLDHLVDWLLLVDQGHLGNLRHLVDQLHLE